MRTALKINKLRALLYRIWWHTRILSGLDFSAKAKSLNDFSYRRKIITCLCSR